MAYGYDQYQEETDEGAVSLGKKAAGVAGSILFSKVLTFIVTGIAFIVVARLLGPSTYGIYTIAVAAAGIFTSFGDFGFSTSITKFIAEHAKKDNQAKASSILANYLTLLMCTSIVLAIITYILAGFIAQAALHNAAATPVLQFAALLVVATILLNNSYAALVGMGKGGILLTVTAVQSVLQAVFSISLALLGFGAMAPLVGSTTAFFIGFIVSMFFITRQDWFNIKKAKATLRGMKEIVRFSAPIGVTGVVSNIANNLSPIVLGIFATAAILGNFGVTYKAASMFDLVIGSVGLSLLPLFSVTFSSKKLAKSAERYYNHAVYLAALFVVPIAFYIAFLARAFSYTVFGAAYQFAPAYIGVMSIGVMISIVYLYANNLLIGAGKSKQYFKYNFAVIAVQLVLLPIVVILFNGIGLVALLFLLVPALLDIIMITRIDKILGIKFDIKRPLMVVVSGIISALFIIPLILLLGNNNIPLLIAAAIEQLLVYPAILVLTRAAKKGDMELVKNVTAHIPGVNSFIAWLVGYMNMFLR